MTTYTTPNARLAAAASPAARPIVTPAATVCSTPEAIERFRVIACLTGLKLESHGIRVHRGLSCLRIARQDYGISARTAAEAHTRLHALLVAHGIITGDTQGDPQ